MRSFGRARAAQVALVLLGCLGGVYARPVGAQEDSRTQPVDPLIGTWDLNVAKSQFPGTPPRAVRRTFDYTLDGMILVAYETTNARGEKSFAHWFMGLDGKEHPEFGRSTGATPIWFLATKVIDTHTKEVIDRRVVDPGQRQQVIYYTIQVSPDGNTMTMTGRTTDAQGRERVTVAVYDRGF
jgi:hypothetical protein